MDITVRLERISFASLLSICRSRVAKSFILITTSLNLAVSTMGKVQSPLPIISRETIEHSDDIKVVTP